MTQSTMIKSSRIGRQIKHFEQVDIGNITAGYSSELHRYKLAIPFLPAIIEAPLPCLFLTKQYKF